MKGGCDHCKRKVVNLLRHLQLCKARRRSLERKAAAVDVKEPAAVRAHKKKASRSAAAAASPAQPHSIFLSYVGYQPRHSFALAEEPKTKRSYIVLPPTTTFLAAAEGQGANMNGLPMTCLATGDDSDALAPLTPVADPDALPLATGDAEPIASSGPVVEAVNSTQGF